MNRIKDKTRDQIMDLFRTYGFKDAMGHDLLLCKDFSDLLDQALATGLKVPNPSANQ